MKERQRKNRKRLVLGVSVVCAFYYSIKYRDKLGMGAVSVVKDYFNDNLKYLSQYKVEYLLTSSTKNTEIKAID